MKRKTSTTKRRMTAKRAMTIVDAAGKPRSISSSDWLQSKNLALAVLSDSKANKADRDAAIAFAESIVNGKRKAKASKASASKASKASASKASKASASKASAVTLSPQAITMAANAASRLAKGVAVGNVMQQRDAYGCTAKDRLYMAWLDAKASGERLTSTMMQILECQQTSSRHNSWLTSWPKAIAAGQTSGRPLPAYAVKIGYKGNKAAFAVVLSEVKRLSGKSQDVKMHALMQTRLANARKLAKC